MTILNFGDNNYLTGNDLWVTIKDFANPVKNLKLRVKNLANLKQHDLVLYPLPNNQFTLNITTAARSLFDAPIHDSLPLNTLAKFEIKFDVSFVGAFPNDVQTINKNFIRGYRNSKGSDKNFIDAPFDIFILTIGKAKFYTNGITNFDEFNKLEASMGVWRIVINSSADLINIQNLCNYKIIN